MAAGGKTEFLRSLTHLLSGSPRGTIPQPQDIVNDFHNVLTPQLINLDSFITLSYVRFDSRSNQVTVVDCGNTRLIRCRADDGKIEFLSGYNLPLGFELSEIYTQAEYNYDPNDVFVFYSDGVTEARNSSGEMFGLKRLRTLISDNRHLAPDEVVDAIRRSATDFVGSAAFTDDFTVVVIKIIPEADTEPPVGVEEIQFTSTLGELPHVRSFLKSFCSSRHGCGLSQHEFRLLELAATEVFSNIVKHAYHSAHDQFIWVRCELTAAELKLRFTHTGEPFVGPDRITLPPVDHQKEGGFGLYIINQVASKVEYSVDNEGRQYIELTRKLRS
jgi:anti-sigma regulatory factor (Ser/Thr protein kinase)